MKIGLVELPDIQLIDQNGEDRNLASVDYPLLSKQILMSNLEAGGFDPHLVNLKIGSDQETYGEVKWGGITLTKTLKGKKISTLDPQTYDAWGVTCNYTQQREVACMVIKRLSSGDRPVVVGGSDAIAQPKIYLQAGATAVVTDKSGAANWAIFDYVLGKSSPEKLTGVILASGTQYPNSLRPLRPEEWSLPSLRIAKQCLTNPSWIAKKFCPVGAVFPDMGCDRKCDFCQTPTYKLGYSRMSPKRVLEWFALQKEAGGRAVLNYSDQFLGRVLFPEGRQEILEIMNGLREMELPVGWVNGLEIKKATLGRGIRPDGDLKPDEELIQSLWGWDGKVGCFFAYIPAERPLVGRESYAKLLPWKEHVTMLRSIVQAGVPRISYGVIIGLPEDSHDSLQYLEDALLELRQELKTINPSLEFGVAPFAISPIPGTPQEQNLRKLGLIRCEDPVILGGWWTPCADTFHLSFEDVAAWQFRLANRVTIQSHLEEAMLSFYK
ncbi:radical SAM protein [Cylindrospermum sp. FACHB-282]|uniref:radical SAM protein n=1 Tax=Cylindrospermum sp. FACHB-282 TaxID=2692794 RepID=UPI0016825E8C|nr:radical SAM protein [Cylindrospermum sp. FACHB-282]MBD2385989.1 radical SAM protein [Cylindrospermum sp. FACHB-282]